MLNKTKAALQGRQCNYKKLNPSQITTLIDQVNSGHKLTAPLAQLIRDARKSAHTGNSTYLKSLATWWVHPNLDRPQPIDLCEILQCRESTPMADTLRKSSLAVQLFSSMPRLSSSRRSNLLIQPDLLSSPSSFIAAARRSDNSLSSLSCTTWRSLLSTVDIVNSCSLVCIGVDNVLHCMTCSKAKPRSARTLTGPLTTNDR
ncbi:Uncharacterised protein [Yersinia intermedia]|nr:Uncharacterised protein [Yersinia intermedia]